jgi:hypothetical protein
MHAINRRSLVAALAGATLAVGLVAVPPAWAVNGLAVNDPDAELEGPGATVTFRIQLTRDSTGTVSVNYTTVPGTAEANVDYVSKTGTAVFSGNETTELVNITILDDAVDEDPEKFTLRLSSPNGATLTDDVGEATITDADPSPLMSISGDTVDEGDSGTTDARFVVALSSPSGRTVSVKAATSDGSATAGSDYTMKVETLTFSPGQVTKAFLVPVMGDVGDEDEEEDFRVTLSEASGASISPPNPARGIIVDDDDTPVLSVNDASGTEGGSVGFTLTLSAASNRPVTVDVDTSSVTAVAGQDYVDISTTITLNPGETTKPFTVTLLQDDPAVDEPDETFLVTLSNQSGALVPDATGTGTVLDDDPGPELYFEPLTVADLENENLTFTVKLSGAVPLNAALPGVSAPFEAEDVTTEELVDYSVLTPSPLVFPPGSPAGSTRTITVTVTDDGFAEGDETFKLRLLQPSGGAQIRRGEGEASGTIQNNDGEPARVSIADTSTAEGTGGSSKATFTVTLSAQAGATAVVTYATSDGTARAGDDYGVVTTERTGAVTFNPGETSKTIDVGVVPDNLDEDDETFTVVLSNPTNAVLERGTATATITDDDNPPVVSINPAAIELDESNLVTSGEDIIITLSPASTKTVTVNFTTGPDTDANTADATADADYSAPASRTLTFKPGETEKRVRVEVVGDLLDEDPEVFNASLASPTNATLPAPNAPAVVTITDDDDPPTVSITGPQPVDEPFSSSGETNAVFVVTLSAKSGRAVMVDYDTSDGGGVAPSPATAPSDYTARTNQTAAITAGHLGTEIAVIVKGDSANEDNEDFTVTLSNPTNAELTDDPAGQSATAVILDTDGPPALSIVDTTVPEGNGPGTATVTVRLLPPAGNNDGDVTVKLGSADGTAVAPGDYQAVIPPAVITFKPGETVQTYDVAIAGEMQDEPDESFQVNLADPTGPPNGPNPAVIATGSAGVTIIDDDGPSISVQDVTVEEGTGSTPSQATFTVRLSAPSPQAVGVDYSTAAASASAPEDFELTSGSLLFAAGEVQRTVSVPVAADEADEADEQFSFSLTNPSNATISRAVARATILDDDQPLLLVSAAAGSADAPSVFEGDAGSARPALAPVPASTTSRPPDG